MYKKLVPLTFAVLILFCSPFCIHHSTAGVIQLPRTGQTLCYNDWSAIIDCANTGQDGDTLAGVAWPTPRFVDNADQTVTDMLTGLVWSKDANPAAATKSWQGALDYINVLNLANYQGHNDWRLPNRNELASLVNAGQAQFNEWLNAQGFTNVQGDYYWSSSTSSVNTSAAWPVHMSEGKVDYDSKAFGNYCVWPVRSGQPGTVGSVALAKTGQITSYATRDDGALQLGVAWPTPRFVDNADQTVTDMLTGLVWSKDANPSRQGLQRGDMTWQDALDYIKDLNLANYQGYNDWRLPNRNELTSLVNAGQARNDLWLNTQGFTNVLPDSYWSSTTISNSRSEAWVVSIAFGFVGSTGKASPVVLWPVRSGQYFATVHMSGDGAGTVTSDSGGMVCTTGTCSAKLPINSAVSLIATPNAYSTFGGWSGACTGIGNCNLTMDSAKSVTATFIAAPKAKVLAKSFSTLQSAYDDIATTSGSIIKLLEGNLDNTLTAGRGFSVKIEGGYDAAYSEVVAETTIQGPVKIRSGTVRVKGINVR